MNRRSRDTLNKIKSMRQPACVDESIVDISCVDELIQEGYLKFESDISTFEQQGRVVSVTARGKNFNKEQVKNVLKTVVKFIVDIVLAVLSKI